MQGLPLKRLKPIYKVYWFYFLLLICRFVVSVELYRPYQKLPLIHIDLNLIGIQRFFVKIYSQLQVACTKGFEPLVDVRI